MPGMNRHSGIASRVISGQRGGRFIRRPPRPPPQRSLAAAGYIFANTPGIYRIGLKLLPAAPAPRIVRGPVGLCSVRGTARHALFDPARPEDAIEPVLRYVVILADRHNGHPCPILPDHRILVAPFLR
jgi:hypothetical protein